jgi:hypothetical protein
LLQVDVLKIKADSVQPRRQKILLVFASLKKEVFAGICLL